MEIEVLPSEDAVARRAAAEIADAIRRTVRRGRTFTFAVSGGRTPWRMLDHLAAHDLPWDRVHVTQVDERVAPDDHADRNWTHVRAHLGSRVPSPANQWHEMPVNHGDPERVAADYAATLARIAGDPPVLDLVHLGLGTDGHTASLVPGDAALASHDAVAATAQYQGRRRVTLTFATLARARRVLWVVTGEEKRDALARLVRGDAAIPAARFRAKSALLLADRAAAGHESR